MPADVMAATGPSSTRQPSAQISPEILARVQSLYDNGLCLQSYREAEALAPIRTWRGVAARTLAGRIAANVGGYQLAQVHHWLAWRADKANPDLLAYHGYTVLQRRGPLAALEFIDQFKSPPENFAKDSLVHLFTLRASLLGHLRDFRGSQQWLERASELDPNHAWAWTCRAHVLELEDRYPEALEASRRALELRPWYRPGIQALAHTLQLLDREEEALQFLTEAVKHVENMHVVRQLSRLQAELGLYREASQSMDQLEALAPLLSSTERDWLHRERISLSCLREDWPAALEAVRQIDEPYCRKLAERLQNGAPRRQVMLNLPFVRQHHMTCVPATLATISRFWGKRAEHLEVAEAICYDGTPAHSERTWAETHGWVTREFTLSWDSARALLDRGIPFTLTTSNATTSHLQAVIGYDEIRQTLWIRDPFVYDKPEFLVEAILETHRSRGPRCMALVPVEKRESLDGFHLPESGMYDELYRVESALAQHRRPDALQVCKEMQKNAPEHRLTLHARRAIAAYDGNTPALLQVFEELLKQFPGDQSFLLAKAQCLRDLARRKERLELLEQLCLKPGHDPVFWQQYAQELRVDAREQTAAASWIKWAMRYRPVDPAVLSAWGDLLTDRREFEKAARYYRFAACIGEKNEIFSQKFFIASTQLRQTEMALEFLETRDHRLGKLAAYPAITRVETLQHLRRTNEALAVLDSALARRPEDGNLHLFAADFYARLSRFETARKLIREVESYCAPVAWHRCAAAAAGYANEKTAALEHWREVLKLEPLAHDAMRAIALLLAETEGRSAGLRFLDEQCARFPASCPLLTLRIDWVQEDGPAIVIQRLRELLDINPADSWAWRELAIQLSGCEKHEEALGAAEEAIRIDPNCSAGFSIRGKVLLGLGRLNDAQNDFRQALRLEVDNEYAMSQYVAAATSLAQRKQALAIIAKELRRQVIFHNALFAYQAAARGLLPPEEVLGLLREAHQARPDLFQAWSVLVHQLIDLGKYEDASTLARQAAEKFPLVPEIWADLARVELARLDSAAQVAAMEKALELRPGFAFVSRELCEVYRRQNKLAEARAVAEEAISANPLDPLNHGCLAEVLWDLGEREPAIARAKHALGLHPGYGWAWNALAAWGRQAGRPQLAAETARELTRLRAGEARSWLRLASCLDPETETDELFAALAKALELNPVCEEAYNIRARTLARLNRCDEALEQCRPPALQPPPAGLILRAALIEAERGNASQAIAITGNLVSEHPNYYEGWKLLSELQLQNNRPEEAVKAAEQMAALAPLDPIPLGYLGDLKLRLRDSEGAMSAFERAFTLDPGYEYAGVSLFHLQVDRRQWDAAGETLKVLQRRGESHRTLCCAVRLAALNEGEHRAGELFKQLCGRDDSESWSIAQAAVALDEQHGPGLATGILRQSISTQGCPPAAAEYWVEREVLRGKWGLHRRLGALEGETQRRAVIRYLSRMGDAFETARQQHDLGLPLKLRWHLWRITSRHGQWLRKDVEGWGKVGYVLTSIGRPKSVVNWLGDWKNRPDAESWMLFNLVLMLQRLKRYDEMLEVLRHMVEMRHGEDYYEAVRLWAAFEETLAGNLAQARTHLANLPQTGKQDLLPVRAMTKLLLSLHEHPAADLEKTRREVRSELRQIFAEKNPVHFDKYVRDAYCRFLKAVEPMTGNQAWWGWWFYRGKDWFWFGAAVLCLLFAVFVPPLILALPLYFVVTRMRRK